MNIRLTKRILIALEHGERLNGQELAAMLDATLEQIGNAMILLRANGRALNVVKPCPGRPPVYAITPFGIESIYKRAKRNRKSAKATEATRQAAIRRAERADAREAARIALALDRESRRPGPIDNTPMVAYAIRNVPTSVFQLGGMQQ